MLQLLYAAGQNRLSGKWWICLLFNPLNRGWGLGQRHIYLFMHSVFCSDLLPAPPLELIAPLPSTLYWQSQKKDCLYLPVLTSSPGSFSRTSTHIERWRLPFSALEGAPLRESEWAAQISGTLLQNSWAQMEVLFSSLRSSELEPSWFLYRSLILHPGCYLSCS